MKPSFFTNQLLDLAKYLLVVVSIVALTIASIFYTPSGKIADTLAEDSKNFFEHSIFKEPITSPKLFDEFVKILKL